MPEGILLRSKSRRKTDDGFRVDRTINLGNLLTLGVIIFTLIGMYQGIVTRMDRVEVKVDAMWNVFVKATK